jgi:hypothetical protein
MEARRGFEFSLFYNPSFISPLLPNLFMLRDFELVCEFSNFYAFSVSLYKNGHQMDTKDDSSNLRNPPLSVSIVPARPSALPELTDRLRSLAAAEVQESAKIYPPSPLLFTSGRGWPKAA